MGTVAIASLLFWASSDSVASFVVAGAHLCLSVSSAPICHSL